MKKKYPTEPALQIIAVKNDDGSKSEKVKYKGKFLPREKVKVDGALVTAKLNGEDFLDFDAGLVTKKHDFYLSFPEPLFSGLLDCMSVERQGDVIKLGYGFWINSEDYPQMDLSPVMLMERVDELADKTGVEASYDPMELTFVFNFYAKPGDNLLKLYKQHIRTLGRLYYRAENEMIKRIIKAQQSKRK